MVLKVSQQYNDHDSTKRRHKTFSLKEQLKSFFDFQLKMLYMALRTHFYKVNQIFYTCKC